MTGTVEHYKCLSSKAVLDSDKGLAKKWCRGWYWAKSEIWSWVFFFFFLLPVFGDEKGKKIIGWMILRSDYAELAYLNQSTSPSAHRSLVRA